VSSLRVKLTLALLVTGLSGVIIVTVLVQRYTTSEFDTFVSEQARADFIANMTAYYEVYGSWEDMRVAGDGLPFPMSAARPELPADTSGEVSPGPPPGDAPPGRVPFMLVNTSGEVVIPGRGYAPGDVIPDDLLAQADPIVVEGATVGYALADPTISGRNRLEQAFLERINQFLFVAMAGAVALALVLSLVFARTLSRPLQEIAAAIQSIAAGNLEQQVPVRSHDEIGQVASAVNQMSANLSRANQLRRQMTADIAHELRTPLSVVVGYLASLSDGLIKPSPERFKIMHDEAQHLQHLVEDLRTLSLADAGELRLSRQWVTVDTIVMLAAAAFEHPAEQGQIALETHVAPDLPAVYVDPDRLLQVLSNLVSNALRHTPEGGRVTLRARRDEQQLLLEVQDTGSGIDSVHLPHVFERLYRADSARYQEQGESGLGLAIAKSLVEAHGGRITAESVVGQGTTISIALPLASVSTPEV